MGYTYGDTSTADAGRSGRRTFRRLPILAALVALFASFLPSAAVAPVHPAPLRSAAATTDGGDPAPAPLIPLTISVKPPTPGQPIVSPGGVFVPDGLDVSNPPSVLLVLHGMGGSGERIANWLQACAARNGMLLLAPSMVYRDYMDLDQVRQDEREILPRLREMLDGLPGLVGHDVSPKVYVYGFSRGAQLAHRFAFFYPDRVAAVASISAGSYTVPRQTVVLAPNGKESMLSFPLGVGDLDRYAGHEFDADAVSQVPFYVSVGGADVNKDSVPRPFDPYLGNNRVERAQHFAQAMRGLGARVDLDVVAGVGHEEAAAMRENACSFFAAIAEDTVASIR